MRGSSVRRVSWLVNKPNANLLKGPDGVLPNRQHALPAFGLALVGWQRHGHQKLPVKVGQHRVLGFVGQHLVQTALLGRQRGEHVAELVRATNVAKHARLFQRELLSLLCA